MSGAVVLLLLLLFVVVPGIPAYVIGERRGVENAWVAFISAFGPTIVMLWSTGRSGWMVLISIVPLVNIVWAIWFAIVLPATHGRTRWWAVAFFFLPVLGYYLYAFTLPRSARTVAAAPVA